MKGPGRLDQNTNVENPAINTAAAMVLVADAALIA